jgi:DNA-directed RNA polymerase specialized sigma24 family protein
MTPTPAQLAKMEEACRAAAKRYDRKRGVQEDLEQAAWVEVLKAVRTFDPAKCDFFPFVWTVALRACKRESTQIDLPLSGLKHRPANVNGVHRAAVHDNIRADGHGRVDLQDMYTRAAFDHRVRERLLELVGDEGLPFALAVLSGEHQTGAIAAYHKVDVAEVRKLAGRVRKLCKGDEKLYRLWRENVDP